jgi:hypothetical protein
VAKDPQQYLTDAVQDYIDYANQLEDRYLRSYGEVMTFGSGDCGQLAHGLDGDDNLMVKYPRIVYSLRSPFLPPPYLLLILILLSPSLPHYPVVPLLSSPEIRKSSPSPVVVYITLSVPRKV